MNKRLEELRAQRDLIQKHLDWIDSELAEATDAKAEAPTIALSPRSDEHVTEASPPSKDSQPKEEATEEPNNETHQPENYATRPVKNDIRTASIGCVVIFVAAISLFLFLLFGLPYLLD
ncbi:MAG TPA: hypothetical protein DCX06_13865 [Opitutae bacterium]|nr:hypothetical protein [Opitutae bacterium]